VESRQNGREKEREREREREERDLADVNIRDEIVWLTIFNTTDRIFKV
jgi:hypothetical protein